jgi:hypothetical protein
MSLATLLDLLSSLLGLFSGAFFCIGVLHLKQASVEAIAFSMWEKGITIASELVAQKFDFIAGAILLFSAFAFQFPVKVWPEYFSSIEVSSISCGVALALSVAVFFAVSLRFLTQIRCKNALQEMRDKKAQQESEAQGKGRS